MGNYGFTVIDGDMKYVDPSGAVIDVAETGSAALFVSITITDDGVTVDKTGKEIYNAISNKIPVYANCEDLGTFTIGNVWDDDPEQEAVAGADLFFNFFESFNTGLLKAYYLSIEGDTATLEHKYFDLSTLIKT